MKTANSIGRVLIRRDNPVTDANQINRKDKERVYLSKRENDNQAHSVQNSVNQNNNYINRIKLIQKKLLIKEDEDEDEEIDHPQPILSESEEELNDIKSHFVQKIENKKNSETNSRKRRNEGVYLKYFKSSELSDYIDLLPEEKKQNVVNNRKHSDFTVNKNSNNIISVKKYYKFGNSINKEFNLFKSQLNNDENKIENHNEKIYNNKEIKIRDNNAIFKDKNEHIHLFNLKNAHIINEQELFQNLKDKKGKKTNDISLGKEYFNNNLNISQQFKSRKHQNNNNSLYYESIYIPISKLKYNKAETKKRLLEEECEKNNSRDKFMQTITSINNERIQNVSIYENIKVTNSINLDQIKRNVSKTKIQPFYLQNKNNSNNSDITKIPNKRKDSNNYLNHTKVNSTEKKIPSFQEKNNLLGKQVENQKCDPKYSQHTFDKGRIYNNVQTTYIVISKKKNTKEISKANIPEAKNNNNKQISVTQSANLINSSKIINDTKTSQGNSLQLQFQRNSSKEPKEKESNNNSTINSKYKNNYILPNNNRNKGTIFGKFIKSSINESNGIYFEKNKNTNILVNKSVNINKKKGIIDNN